MIIVFIIGFYLSFVIFLSATNFLATVLFKVIPFISGVYLMLHSAKELGWIQYLVTG